MDSHAPLRAIGLIGLVFVLSGRAEAPQVLCTYEWPTPGAAALAAGTPVGGAGFALVRRRQAGSTTWHPLSDNATGTQSYGAYPSMISAADIMPASFSIAYAEYEWDDFVVATGDRVHWAWLPRAALLLAPTTGTLSSLMVNASSLNASAHALTWAYRVDQTEDPWISDRDHLYAGNTAHADGASDHSMLYGEDSFAGWTHFLANRNGANVWIRSPDLCPPSGVCSSMAPSNWVGIDVPVALVVPLSGFIANASIPTLRLVFEMHRKYSNVSMTLGAFNNLTQSASPANVSLAVANRTSSLDTAHADCYDQHTIEADWPVLAPLCENWQEGSGVAGFDVFACKLRVRGEQVVDPLDFRNGQLTGSRVESLAALVKFPKHVAAFSSVLNVTLASNASLVLLEERRQVEITTQRRVSISRQGTRVVARVLLRSESPAEFALAPSSRPPRAATRENLNLADVRLVQDCSAGVGSVACVQKWSADVVADANVICKLNGAVEIPFRRVPRARASSHVVSRVDQPEGDMSVVVSVISDPFCPVFVSDVGLRAVLAAFSGPPNSEAKSSYLPGETVNLVATIDAARNSVVSVRLVNVDVSIAGAGPLRIWGELEDGGATNRVRFVEVPNVVTPFESRFGFIIDPEYFELTDDSPVEVVVTATLAVELRGAGCSDGTLVCDAQATPKTQTLAASATLTRTAADSSLAKSLGCAKQRPLWGVMCLAALLAHGLLVAHR